MAATIQPRLTGARTAEERWAVEPLRVYGSEVSYFTGKLEGYLRYKEIAYERIRSAPRRIPGIADDVAQVPVVQLPDGRWMTDTTPIIAWLETRHPEPAVIPIDPLQAFFSRLLEDYADEWLWRPAMHHRWDHRADSLLLRRKLADELLGHVPLPRLLKRFAISTRQRILFTRGDGVNRRTWNHVEGVYLKTLGQLETILGDRPYLLGDRPTLADFGFFGSMFRHFGMDPTPSMIMRERASEVYAWVARVWNARAGRESGELVSGLPDDWGPILDAIGAAYLPHLCANAEAWKDGRRRFSVEVEGVRYERLRTARYRVWCLEQLRHHFEVLPDATKPRVRSILEKHRCWEPLWRVADTDSGVDRDGSAPFGRGHSMTGLGS
jgi:glutathione S-transferase